MAGIPQSEAEVGEIAPAPGSGGRKPMPIEGRVIRGTKGVVWWVLIRISLPCRIRLLSHLLVQHLIFQYLRERIG